MKFSTIKGHLRAIDSLKSAITRGTIHHAYLFVGPAGIGKTTLARTTAAALTCHGLVDGDPCGTCPSCQQLEQGTQPNIRIMGTGKKAVAVDEIRDLIRWVGLKTLGGGHRVVVIRNAHLMNDSASNALLKSLEEPPPNTTFFLTSTGVHTLLPTIRSRCQLMTLTPLKTQDVIDFLQEKDLPEERILGMALLSGGAIGRALALTDDALETRSTMVQRVLTCGDGGLRPLFDAAEADGRDADYLQALLTVIESLLRDSLVLKLAPGSPIVNQDVTDTLLVWAQRRSLGDLYKLVSNLTRARRETRLNIPGRVVLERLYLGLGEL